jgi:DNA (cytosine-5)-methyltransferase 1
VAPLESPHPLRQTDRPRFEDGSAAMRVVDLFAGCGGLTLGVAQAAADSGVAIKIPLAIDFEAAATKVYASNFPQAHVVAAPVEAHFDGTLEDPITETELRTAAICGEVHVLIGGPPCQGHSNLNNHTRREDPKNALYARMARAAQVLRPKYVLIENVPAVCHDTGNVVDVTSKCLSELGYVVATATVALHALGVAQTRRRHLLLASRVPDFDPRAVLEQLTSREVDNSTNLRWAIGDLANLSEPTGYDAPPRASEQNKRRMHYLLNNNEYDLPNTQRPKCHQDDHSYKSMYGRLRWDLPAQTITSGFGSIGQGRYMHPDEPRALTAHEAARIQGFPDYFHFSAVTNRGALATMIGNAVPPALSREVAAAFLSLDRESSTDRESEAASSGDTHVQLALVIGEPSDGMDYPNYTRRPLPVPRGVVMQPSAELTCHWGGAAGHDPSAGQPH